MVYKDLTIDALIGNINTSVFKNIGFKEIAYNIHISYYLVGHNVIALVVSTLSSCPVATACPVGNKYNITYGC